MISHLSIRDYLSFENDGTYKDERKHHGAVDKSFSNNRSMLRMASAFVMLKIEPIHLGLVGFQAGRPSVWQAKKLLFSKFSKFDNSTSDMSLGFLNLLLAFARS